MENYGDEAGVPDYMRLMKDYLEGRINVDQYKRAYFVLGQKRVNIPDPEADRITQQAYGDADDYKPDPALDKPIRDGSEILN
ncbi:MAG: hypothetical protein ACLP1Y_05795 [Candidatus Acidiferrales bacterium]